MFTKIIIILGLWGFWLIIQTLLLKLIGKLFDLIGFNFNNENDLINDIITFILFIYPMVLLVYLII